MRKDIAFGRPMIGPEERAAVMEVLLSPQLVHGPRAKAFETAFARFLGSQAHATAVSSCTAGLHLVYMHLGIGPGDEVVVPAQTHVATAHAVEVTGARPVFVDCEPDTGNINAEGVAAAITDRTRAISVVHYLGLPVEMGPIVELARSRNLFVVEDCALAVGSAINGDACGLIGDAGSFSFYPVKHMTTAEGGIVVSRHADVVASVDNIKAFGYDRGLGERRVPGVYDIARLGLNYRMNEIAAAIGLEQLKKVPEFLRRRASNAAALRAALTDVEEVTVLADGDGRRTHGNYCLTVLLDDRIGSRRAEIVHGMKNRGVGTSVYYPVPVPLSAYYRDKYGQKREDYRNASRISSYSIALPVGPHLVEADMRLIVEALKQAIQENRA